MKISKRILSIILSILMVATMLPMSVMADDVTLETAKNALDAFTAEQFNANAYYEGTVATNGFKNIVYSSTSSSFNGSSALNGDAIKFNNVNLKVVLPTKIVMVYDGTDAYIPVVLENQRTNSSSQRFYYFESQEPNMAFKQNWCGYVSGYTYGNWPGNSKSLDNCDDTFGYNSSTSKETVNKQDNTTSRFWWNKMYYTGSGNKTDYYEKYDNIKFTMNSKNNSNKPSNGTVYSVNSTYVVNYKAITDKISSAKTDVANYIDSGKTYTQESITAYNNAVAGLVAVNIADNFALADDNNVASAVESAAKEIKDAIDAYDAVTLEEYIEPAGPQNTANLTLDDKVEFNFQIDTNYYLENDFAGVDESELEYEVSYVNKTVDYENPSVTVVETKDAVVESNGKTLISLETAPAQLTEKVKITLKKKGEKNGTTVVNEYSMKDYCDAVITANMRTAPVCKELIKYAATAQTYFGYNNTEDKIATEVDAAFKAQLRSDYENVDVDTSFAGVQKYTDIFNVTGVSYVALSDATLRFYLPETEAEFYARTHTMYGDYDITFNMVDKKGDVEHIKAYFAKNDSDQVYIAVAGIESANLDNQITVTVAKDGDDQMTIDYSAIAFCKSAVANGAENLKNLARAITLYNVAADSVF